MTPFTEVSPTLDNYWRAVILFGRNVASYKFALGQTLLELAEAGRSLVPLAELAVPYARHLTAHLRGCDTQGTSAGSRFLDECRRFNRGELSAEHLAEATAKLGFQNVLDAFHIVGGREVGVRFFLDERAGPARGVRLTDDLFRLTGLYQGRNLPQEVEARWRLVETAWALNLPTAAVVMAYDADTGGLVPCTRSERRAAVTSCRDALNGYQKGKCFYCFADVSVTPGAADRGDVDHLFPHRLKPFRVAEPVDGVWNLVLACQGCNRGEQGKFDRLPATRFLERLHTRNEFLIASHHPLRETLVLQTGASEPARRAFLAAADRAAVALLIHRWRPRFEHPPAF